MNQNASERFLERFRQKTISAPTLPPKRHPEPVQLVLIDIQGDMFMSLSVPPVYVPTPRGLSPQTTGPFSSTSPQCVPVLPLEPHILEFLQRYNAYQLSKPPVPTVGPYRWRPAFKIKFEPNWFIDRHGLSWNAAAQRQRSSRRRTLRNNDVSIRSNLVLTKCAAGHLRFALPAHLKVSRSGCLQCEGAVLVTPPLCAMGGTFRSKNNRSEGF